MNEFLGGWFTLAVLLFGFEFAAFRVLPRERWQILAAVPVRRRADGQWEGVNLTSYGALFASATVFAVALFVWLARALGVRWLDLTGVVCLVLLVAGPAAKGLAELIERRRGTLTVGGAVFVALFVAPLVLSGLPRVTGRALPSLALLAALGIAYAFGEGLGRLACISFGCCYGRPLSSLPRAWQRGLAPLALTFHGATHKASYASGLAGVPLVPIQAVSALVLTTLGLAGLGLFLAGAFAAAFLLAFGGSQVWRVLSELWRADHRGGGRLSAYQWMALLAVPVSGVLAVSFPAAPVTLDLQQAWAGLARLEVVAALGGLAGQVFYATGRSTVTGAVLSFHVREHETRPL